MYNELIDALRNCACIKNVDHCKICGYRHSTECGRRIADDAADAIERTQAELAKKDSQISEWKNAWRIANSLYKSAQAEIDEHRAYQHELVERIETLKAELSELKQTEQNEPEGTEPKETKGEEPQ